MPTWLAPLDPGETKVYTAQFKAVLSTSEILTGTPTVTLPSAAATAGLNGVTPVIVNDPDDASIDTAINITFSVDLGNQSDAGWDNAGVVYAIDVSCDTDGGQTLEASFNLTVKQAGSPVIPWTYDQALSTDRDRVRLMIGDVDVNDQLLSDSELDAYVTGTYNIDRVAANLCRFIAGKFARLVSGSVDGVRISIQQKYTHYRQLAVVYDDAALASTGGIGAVLAGTAGVPLVSGVSLDGIDIVRDDTDRRRDVFQRGQFDHPDINTVARADDGTA